MFKITLRTLLLLLIPICAPAQIQINEIAAIGTILADEDNDTPDWIEIQNSGNQVINLDGYSITDDVSNPKKWKFPNHQLAPNTPLVLFASGKNRNGTPTSATHHWEAAILDGASCTYSYNTQSISSNWMETGFVPVGWNTGTSGIGYGDADDNTTIPEGTISVYTRFNFTVSDGSKFSEAVLHIDYDDGFVAYLNGIEIARKGLSGNPPAWNEEAQDREAIMYNGLTPEDYPLDINQLQSLLTTGNNVLAIELHNTSAQSSDMTLRPFLHFGITDETIFFNPPATWFANGNGMSQNWHTNFKIKPSETVFIFNNSGVLIDSVTVKALQRGHAQARFAQQWCITDTPSPNETNDNSICYTGYSTTPQISPASGFYNTTQVVTINGSNIRYTLDGSMPNPSALAYNTPLSVDQTTTIRAVNYETGKLPAVVTYAAYFIGAPTQLPVVHITANPEDLFSNAGNGPAVYDNYWGGNKVPCQVSYYNSNKQLQFTEQASVGVVGNFSVAFAQKSLQFVFDRDFNAQSDVANIFSLDKPALGPMHGFRIRNTDDDASNARMRDVVANRITLPTHAAKTASQNVAVYVNNEYWGHYAAREMLNRYFVRDNYGSDPEQVDIVRTYVGTTLADAGTLSNFESTRDFLINNDLSIAANFEAAKDEIDLENWVDYWAAQIYVANADWYSSMYQNNIMCFRGYAPEDTKWKFAMWDVGYSQDLFGGDMAANYNSLDWALGNPAFPNQYTDMFNGLLANEGFKRYFINRFADLLNVYWTPAKTQKIVDENAAAMASEVQANYDRWIVDCAGNYCPPNFNNWQNEVTRLRNFHGQRPAFQRNHINDYFDLEGQKSITINVLPAGSGTVQISTVTPTAYPWSGTYFKGIPVKITATPSAGYTFEKWSPNSSITDLNQSSIEINPATTQLTANFTTNNLQASDITCSEINYNSHPSKASGNWIELHNYGSSAANIGGFRLQEEGVATFFNIPANTTIPANGYLVLSDDVTQFKTIFPNVTNVIGPTGIALGNNGDTIRLLDAGGATVLRIGFLDALPWPQCADGHGRTLENKVLNNNTNLLDPTRWKDGCMGGSPGVANTPCNEPLFFNEINYRSSNFGDAGDWVEIWNRSGQDVNLSGWQLRDRNDTLRFTMPNGTMVKKDSFIVFYSDLFLFTDVHPGGAVPNKVGPFEFGLSGNGDLVRLFDQNKDIVLSMFYNDAAPWPLEPDGQGPTLELRAPFTDLNVPQNWAASCDFGTPGRKNSPCSSSTNEIILNGAVQVAPNPANGIFNISTTGVQPQQWQLYDLGGRLVKQGIVPEGQNTWTVDASNWAEGMYLVKIMGEGWIATGKLVVLNR
jgi:hypothetical protein